MIFLLIGCNKPTEPSAHPVRISDLDQMEQISVPSGAFEMGANRDDKTADADEIPQHKVYLDSFWLDRTEITNAMYTRCVTAKRCTPPAHSDRYSKPEYANHPVLGVAWTQAQSYCMWAGRRLPTEAEWERAARGTDGRIYPWGNFPPEKNLLNFNQQMNDTTAVGSYLDGASPYGALDMAGNVWEWAADWYDVYPGGDANASSDFGQKYRVMRGGSWSGTGNFVRSAYRNRFDPANSYDVIGFRCSRSP